MKKGDLIYIDYNSTTPVDPRVLDRMMPFFYEMPGNASSKSHAFGWQAESAVGNARAQVAELLRVDPEEVVFTSGATESDNLALKGVYEMYHRQGDHIITLSTEHSAVLDACERIEKNGGRVTYLDPGEDGLINLTELESAITDQTIMISVMWANNETGVIQPMAEIGDICKRHGVLLMSDATQAVGKIATHPRDVGVHLMAFTAHKMYGPKGIGALYVCGSNPQVRLRPQIDGGHHEQGRRSGTLNVPGIVGLGSACAIALDEMQTEADRLSVLRDGLESQILQMEETYVNGSTAQRLPHVSNLAIRYVEGEVLMGACSQQLAMSSGSACTSASLDPSHVLTGMGLSDQRAHNSIRLSLGRYSDHDQVVTVAKRLSQAVAKLRSESPAWMLYRDGMHIDW